MTITIRRASEFSLEQLTDVWNEGFSDYYVQMQFTVEMFTNRFAFDELMPTRSVVACMEGKPVGMILNGIRTIRGQKVAWNGGTCVIPHYRRYGIGKVMMDASLAIYEEEGVELATLEAFKQNERAIALYEQKGYAVVDYLYSYERKDAFHPVVYAGEQNYHITYGSPYAASQLPFYNVDTPWQSHWQNLRAGGETIIIWDNNQPVGYLLYKQSFDEQGNKKDVLLYQCEVDPTRNDRESMIRYGLNMLFASEEPIPRCATFNTMHTQPIVREILQDSGFDVRIEQVYMTRKMTY